MTHSVFSWCCEDPKSADRHSERDLLLLGNGPQHRVGDDFLLVHVALVSWIKKNL